jgi:hypothetical protein
LLILLCFYASPFLCLVKPSTFVITYFNWETTQNITFYAPAEFDVVTFTYVLSGLNENQFVPPTEDSFEITILGYFKINNPIKSFWLGQPYIFDISPIGYLPGCYLGYTTTPALDSLFDPPDRQTFTPLVPNSNFIFFAPTSWGPYWNYLNATMSFELVGGPDFDKMFPPAPFTYVVNRTDLWQVTVLGGAWQHDPDFPWLAFPGVKPINFTGIDPLTGYWYDRSGFGYWWEYNATVIHGIGRVTIDAVYDTPNSVTAWTQTMKWTNVNGTQKWVRSTSAPVLIPNNTHSTVWFEIRGVGVSTLFIRSVAKGQNFTYKYNLFRLPTDVNNVRIQTVPGVFLGGIVGDDMSKYIANWDPATRSRVSSGVDPLQHNERLRYDELHIRGTLRTDARFQQGTRYTGLRASPELLLRDLGDGDHNGARRCPIPGWLGQLPSDQ